MAPAFTAPAIVNGNKIEQNFNLEQFKDNKNVLLFFYPKDFTFVCPTEIITFQENLHEFEARNVQIVGCSTDTIETHLAWLDTPLEKGGIKGVTYPIISDEAKTISANYGVLGGDWSINNIDQLIFEGIPVAFRGTYLIDTNGIIRYQSIHDLPLGRNIKEFLRIIDMLDHYEKNGEVCPANWKFGKKAIQPNRESTAEYLVNDVFESIGSGSCCGGGCR